MEFIKPYPYKFTIYSKSGCINCRNVKHLLTNKNIEYHIINCDEYLLENRTEFLQFIQQLTQMNWKTFPLVFHNENFIGGFKETEDYLNNFLLDFNSNF
jgi:glutaredoxin